MDEIARGVAIASLILQSAVLRPLVADRVMTLAQALNVVEKALGASLGKASSKEKQDVALVTVQALEGVREGLADVVNQTLGHLGGGYRVTVFMTENKETCELISRTVPSRFEAETIAKAFASHHDVPWHKVEVASG
jgi:hypothetical protein